MAAGKCVMRNMGKRVGLLMVFGVFLVVGLVSKGIALGEELIKGRIHCERPHYNYGAVNVTTQQSVVHTFFVSNEGEETLHVSRVKTCCGMTAKLYDAYIDGGSTGRVEVTVSLAGKTGRQRHALYLHSSDPSRPIFQLLMTGRAVRSVEEKP